MTGLHPRLAADNIREIFELGVADRVQLLDESCRLSGFLMDSFKGDKLNIAAIGNLVPQLHLHHVVRFQSDRAWPMPVWGKFPAVAYTETELEQIMKKLPAADFAGFEAAPGSWPASDSRPI